MKASLLNDRHVHLQPQFTRTCEDGPRDGCSAKIILGGSGVATMANEWPRPQGMSLFQAQSCCGLALETTLRRSTPGVKTA